MTTYKTKKIDRNVYQIIENRKGIAGFAIRLPNGKWSMTDANHNRMDSCEYATPDGLAHCFAAVRASKAA